MKRAAHPPLSDVGHKALAFYERWLREREDLAAASIRNYLSDLRHFIAWYETAQETYVHDCFTPQGITTPALTR
jgi:integrase/recombinase XerC